MTCRRLALLPTATVVALSCCVSASAATEPDSLGSTNFAKRVNLGDGRSMYVECRGKGSPTVLLLFDELAAP